MTREAKRAWRWAMAAVLLLSVYPMLMGLRVLTDVLQYGHVFSVDYPKYVIPYTPISLAVVTGMALLPLLLRRRRCCLMLCGLAAGVFLLAELLLENVLVQGYVSATVESWQMYMCYQPITRAVEATGALRLPDALSEVEVLMGAYNPAFKLHFYLISLLLIWGMLGSALGFVRMADTGDWRHIRLCIAQTAATLAFLAMCVLACFTAFFRDGALQVSPLSALLMAVFFVLLGLTAGMLCGVLLRGRGARLARGVPACIAAGVTLLMYLGEMALLSGHVYRFGTGFLFEGMGPLVLAPVDLLIVLLSGGACAALLRVLQKDA